MPWSNYFKDQLSKIKEQKKQETAVVKQGEYYKFDLPEDQTNFHYNLAEELLVPRLNNSDAQRIQMFSSHLTQTVHLLKPEYPKTFTNFENQFGDYSIAYKKAKGNFKIIAKISKNAYNYDMIIQYLKTKEYDVVHYRRAEHITEEYGYAKDDCLQTKAAGDVVQKGEYLYKAPNYDDNGNFGMGVNLKATFLCWDGLTYEDAAVISQSAAKKLTSYKVEETIVSINNNDVLLNLYSTDDDTKYHSFPHVGEHTKNNVLVASRREENQTLLYNFQFDKMKQIHPNDDITYSGGGVVTDIDIYCNAPLEVLKKKTNEFTQELVNLLEDQNRYYEECSEELEKILPIASEDDLFETMTPSEKTAYLNERKDYGFNWKRPMPKQKLNGIKYTEEFGFFWKQVHEYLDDRIQWRIKGKSFKNIKIKFTVLKENKLTIGSKITGRYGNKGVVSMIEKDENMPLAEDGTRAEIILNSLGVLNRMNPSQLYEQHINFMSDHVVKLMKALPTTEEKLNLYFDYLENIDKEEFQYMKSEITMMTNTQKDELVEEIEEKGIYIHQAPFFNNTKYTKFSDITITHPEWCKRYKCKNIHKPLVIGDIYFIRLKHESSNKCSFVSADTINNKNQPAKSNLKKVHKTLFANTPIRLGDMEVENLLLTKSGKEISKLLKSYSTSKEDRENLIKKLLTADNPFDITTDIEEKVSINRKILEKYLSVLELSLENSGVENQ